MDTLARLEAEVLVLKFYVDWMLNHGKFDREILPQEVLEMTNSIQKMLDEKYPGIKAVLPDKAKN